LAAGQPLIAKLWVVNGNVNEWYEVCDIEGAGHIIQLVQGSANATLDKFEGRLTIDDGAATVYSYSLTEAGLFESTKAASDLIKIIPVTLLKYDESFKWEVRQTQINWRSVGGLASYLPD